MEDVDVFRATRKRGEPARPSVSWLTSRLTKRRLAVVGAIALVAGLFVALGDPLAHPEEGEQATGERGVAGVPRIVFFAGLAIAFVLAFPPDDAGNEPGDPPD